MNTNTEALKINKYNRAFLPGSYLSKFIKKIYKTLMNSLQEPGLNHEDSKTPIIWQAFLHLIFYLQYTSLYWKQGIKYSGWANYESFWRVLSFSRLDTIFYILQIELQAYYTFTAIVYFNLLIFILTVVASSEKKSIPKILKWLFQKVLFVQNTFLFIPMLTFFSAITAKIVNLPSIYQNTSLENMNSWHLANCVICLLLHISTSFVYEIMTFEVRHCFAVVDLKAKSTCMIDFKKMISTIVTVELYCFLPVDRLEISHSLNVIVSIWLCVLYWMHLPYYNKIMNTIVFSTTISKMFTAFCFVFTYIIDSSGFLMLSNIIIIPSLLVMMPWLMDFRYGLIKKTEPKDCRNAFYLELQLRNNLIICDESDIMVLDIFGEYLVAHKDNLDSIALWECSHCIYALQDCKLALIKLGKIYKTSPSLTTDFQAYKLRQILKKSKAMQPEDLEFFNYMKKVEKIKQIDQNATEDIVKLAAEIVSENPSMKKINELMIRVTDQMKYITENYNRFCKKHPKNTECVILLKSLIESIYNDEKINPEKIYCSEDCSISFHELVYFDQTNGIIIVSGDESNIGIITYCNEQFGSIINESPSHIINNNISSYIPYPYSQKHNTYLLNFARKCTSSILRFPCTLLFQNEKGFLIECYVKVSCLALDGHIFYLALAQGIHHNYQRALVNTEGMIFAHTKNFPKILNYNAANCQNINLNHIIPRYNIESHSYKIAVPIDFGDKKVLITKVLQDIGSTSMLSVIAVEDEEDLKVALGKNTIEISGQIRLSVMDKGIREKKFSVLEQFGGRVISEESKTTFSNSNEKFNLSETSLNIPQHFNELAALKTRKGRNEIHSYSISRAVSNSYKLILLMKWLFFIVVSFFIITNAITSYFIARDIKTDIIEIYGQFSDFVHDSSVKMAYLNFNSTVINADLKAEMAEFLLKNSGIEEKLREKLLSYKSCHISKHLLDDGALNLYYISNNTEIRHKNAYDFIKAIKSALDLYIENPKNKENLEFLLNTTMITALPQIESYLYDIIGCSNTAVNTLNTINYVIVVVQVSLLIASFLLKFSEVIKILQNFNRIWTTIGENVHKYYYQIRDRCINRLTENLNIKEEEVFHLYDLTATKIPKFSITPKQIFGQMWIVILFIAVSFVYFLVVSQIYYIKIGENIKNANNFNHLLYKHKGYLSQIDFWTVAGLSNYTSKGIQKEQFLVLWEKFSKNVQAIENEICFIHVDSGIYDSLYKKNSQNLIKNGAIHESEIAYYDSFYISEINDFLEIDVYRKKMQDLRSVVELNIENTFAYGKKIAMDEINQIIVWSVLYTIFAFSMFFFIYLPFLSRQRVYFKHIEILAKIFVN